MNFICFYLSSSIESMLKSQKEKRISKENTCSVKEWRDMKPYHWYWCYFLGFLLFYLSAIYTMSILFVYISPFFRLNWYEELLFIVIQQCKRVQEKVKPMCMLFTLLILVLVHISSTFSIFRTNVFIYLPNQLKSESWMLLLFINIWIIFY